MYARSSAPDVAATAAIIFAQYSPIRARFSAFRVLIQFRVAADEDYGFGLREVGAEEVQRCCGDDC
jgi:hypothetical protein